MTVLRKVVPPVVLGVVLLALWQWYVVARDIPLVLLPAPSDIWRALIDERGALFAESGVTFRNALGGTIIGFIGGVGLACAASLVPLVRVALRPVASAAQAVPVLALAPAFVLWLGFGTAPKLVTVAWVTGFLFLHAATAGLEATDRDLVELLESVGASRWEVLRHARVPSSFPYLFAAGRLGAGLAITGAVIAEWTGSAEGLGYIINAARQYNATPTMWAAVVASAALALLLAGAVALGERAMWARRGGRSI